MPTAKRVSIVLAVAALAAVSVSVFAAEGRTPIWTPTTITTGGKYIVTRNITSAGGPVIDIQASGVDIDLNGFVLDGTGIGPVIQAQNVNEITIRNGKVINGSDHVLVNTGKEIVIEDLQIFGAGEGTRGIALEEVTEFALRRNQVRDVAGVAIEVITGTVFPTTSGAIVDNQIDRCQDGISLEYGRSVSMRDNHIRVISGNLGIRVFASQGVLLARNTVHDTAGSGIALEESWGCKLYNNVVTLANGPAGIELAGSHDSLLLDNVVNECATEGMRIDGERNHLERNTLNRNGASGSGFGLLLNGATNVYRGNMARGNNGAVAACGGLPATPDICDNTSSNTSHGDNYMPSML